PPLRGQHTPGPGSGDRGQGTEPRWRSGRSTDAGTSTAGLGGGVRGRNQRPGARSAVRWRGGWRGGRGRRGRGGGVRGGERGAVGGGGGPLGGGGGAGGGGGQMGGGFTSGLTNQNQTGAGGTQLVTPETAPVIGAPGSTTTNTNTAINTTNFLRNTYANPYYQGWLTNAKSQVTPGGFGQAYAPTTTGGTGTRGGVTGGVGGFGGRGGTGSLQNSGGVVVPLPRQIAYSAQVRFDAPPAAPAALFTDLRGTLDRSNMIANPAGVQV